MNDILLQEIMKRLSHSPTELTKKNVAKIKTLFPVPVEYQILWAMVSLSTRASGIVVTDKALIIKADEAMVKKYNAAHPKKKTKKKDQIDDNEAAAEKSEQKTAIYHLIKWEYFDPDNFTIQVNEGTTTIFYADMEILSSIDSRISKIFRVYREEEEKITKASTAASASVFADAESVTPANFSKVNTKTGHGEMAEEALTLLDRLSGKKAETVGRTNEKNGADRIVDGICIQTKYCASGKKCINDCFDKTSGLFRYFNPDGTPMQVEVPSDKYYEAINAFRSKILEGKVPGVTNPDDAAKYIRKGKLTYQQALNLCKTGTIESLSYDAATGFVTCTFALGISFLSTFVLCYCRTGSKKQAMGAAMSAGLQVFGASFLTHILASQLARSTLTKQLIPVSQHMVEKLGYKAVQNIVNAIRAMSGKAAISGAAAMKQLAKMLRSNAVTSAVTLVVFSVPDTYNMFAKKISGAQYTKNMLSLVGSMAAAGGGTLAASLGTAKAAAAVGTAVNPGLGTAVGLVGGLAGGLVGGAAIKALGDKIREDDTVILSRMFNAVVMNLTYEYLLQEPEVNVLIEKLNGIKAKDFKSLFKKLLSSDAQEKEIDNLVRPFFEEIIKNRPAIAAPTADDIINMLETLGIDDKDFGNDDQAAPEEKLQNEFTDDRIAYK